MILGSFDYLHAIAAIVIGLIVLAWAADRTVTAAAAIADNFGIPPLLIGLTIVAVGTSAPEIFVAVTASWQGNPELAIGNAIGSNIANVGLVLGVAALLTPMKVQSRILRREYPILLFIMFIAWLLMLDGNLGRMDGSVLLLGTFFLLLWLIWLAMRSKNDDPMKREFDQEIPHNFSNARAISWLVIGLVLLPLGSYILVDGATDLAKIAGISDLVIGLTIVAIGTSLPEIAAAIIGSMRGEHDIAIGNVLGSNMFNLLLVLGLPALIHPSELAIQVLIRDMPIMFGLTILLFMVAYGRHGVGHIRRWEGAVLLSCYAAYLYLVFLYA